MAPRVPDTRTPLLALIDDPDAAAVMRACAVDLDKLRGNLVAYIESASLITDRGEDSTPSAEFERIIRRAVTHVQSSGRKQITGANVLVAILTEHESRAACFLQEQGLSRSEALKYMAIVTSTASMIPGLPPIAWKTLGWPPNT